MTRLLTLVLVASLASIACFGGDDDEADTPTIAVATTTPIPEFTPSPTRPPPTQEPEASLLSAVWLYDIESGERLTLFEDAERRVVTIARFDGDAVTVRDRSASTGMRYDLNAQVIPEPTPAPNTHQQCTEVPGGAEVGGNTYTGAACGLISPDLRWMLYEVDAGQLSGSYPLPVWDQWAVNLKTSELRLLQEGLLHCGGCDGRFGRAWSPSGRFVYFPELAQHGRTFLHDFETGITRLLFEGSTEIDAEPVWSPAGDLLLRRGDGGLSVLEDPASGTIEELPDIRWPARFDPSGRYVYERSGDEETAIYDTRRASLLANLDGTAIKSLFDPSEPVRALDDTFAALLEWGSACEGASVYRGAALQACIDVLLPNPYGPNHRDERLRTALSPDGRFAAIARLVEAGDPPLCTEQPCGQATIEALYRDRNYNPSWRVSRYEVLLVDTESGEMTVLSDQPLSPSPPHLLWHEDGTHLLVSWPYEASPTGP